MRKQFTSEPKLAGEDIAEERFKIHPSIRGDCLTDNGLCPDGDVVCVALEKATLSHAEEQTGLCVVDRVVVDINPIGKQGYTLAVEYRLLVARNNLSDWHIVTAFKYSLCYSRGIDGRVTRRHEEQADEIACLASTPDEIDLSSFIVEMLGRGAHVVAPRWNGETYELAKLKGLSGDSLRRGPMNILEPAEAEIAEPPEVAVWIIPGLAFTKDGRRLGYGGGWYDRLLAAAAGDSLKIGVAHEFQIVDDLPYEPHDALLSRVVTTAPDLRRQNA